MGKFLAVFINIKTRFSNLQSFWTQPDRQRQIRTRIVCLTVCVDAGNEYIWLFKNNVLLVKTFIVKEKNTSEPLEGINPVVVQLSNSRDPEGRMVWYCQKRRTWPLFNVGGRVPI